MKILFFLLFCLLALAASGQHSFPSDNLSPVSPEILTRFDGARCLQRGEATEHLEAYGFHRFRQLAPFYKPMGTYPFCVYFREEAGEPLFPLFKGFCRGLHVTVPVVYRGFYYVVVFDEQQPSLLEVDARTQEMKARFAAACVLH